MCPTPAWCEYRPVSSEARVGQQRRRVVELREAQAAGGQLVEVGRGDLAAVAADVAEAHVVHQDDDDVGFGRLGFSGSKCGWQSQQQDGAQAVKVYRNVLFIGDSPLHVDGAATQLLTADRLINPLL